MENVILIGFMGSGKSSLGVKLSYRMKMPLLDTDKMIERKQGCTISGLFQERGEEAFRAMETECIREIGNQKGSYVISTGGGLPVKEENRALLQELGTVVYLRIRPETVYERLKEDTTRPLLQGEDPMEKIKTLMEERKEAYENCAELIIDVDDVETESILGQITRYCRKKQYAGVQRRKTAPGTKLLVINGPNLNFLGIREKSVYGTEDYNFLLHMLAQKGKEENCRIEVFQSNHEGAIIDRI